MNKIIKYGRAELAYKSKEQLAQKPILRNLFWETTLKCNANCLHCGSRAGANVDCKDELTTDEIKNAFKVVAEKHDVSNVVINVTGGEPLLRKDLFDVMEYAVGLGYQWVITTNGIMMTDKVISEFNRLKLGGVSLSIDGLSETHNAFRRFSNAYEKTMENIVKLKDSGYEGLLMITTVVHKKNIDELEDLYKIVKDLGAHIWRIGNMDPIGRALENDDLSLDKVDYKRVLDFVKEKRKQGDTFINWGCTHYLGIDYEQEVRELPFNCVAGTTTASILYNGDIYVCPNVERRPELVQGNVRKDNFIDVWNNKFEWFRNMDKFKCEECSKCSDWKYCLGDSLHTWDFDNNRPRLCINKMLNEK